MPDDISFSPKTPVRPSSLYISWHLHKSLGYVARKTGRSREDLAEIVLNAFISQEHPEIVQWMEQRAADEEDFLKKIKPVPFT